MTKFDPNLSIDAYHEHPSLSNSGLNLFAISPRHFAMRGDLDTKAIRDGRTFHTFVLEPEKFDKLYTFGPEAARNTKEWKAFVQEHRGKEVLKPSEVEGIWEAAAEVTGNRMAATILKDAQIEHSFFWTDEETGVECRCRPDSINKGSLADLKKTVSASPNDFVRSCIKYGYHRQAAFYSDGYQAVTGEKVEDFFFIATEIKSPFCCEVYRVPEDMMEAGRRQYKALLVKFAECVKLNDWPGYNGRSLVTDLEWPKWATNKEF